MTANNYINIIEALNERFLSSNEVTSNWWSFSYTDYGYARAILFNDVDLWNSEHNNYDEENDLDWTEESLLKFCEKQYRDYITKLYRTLEL